MSLERDVTQFCIKEFLDVMEKSNGIHEDPFEVIVGVLQKKHKISREDAYGICRPPYWVLMSNGILEYKGTHWRLAKNNVVVGNLVQEVHEDYGKCMKERVEILR